MSRSSGGSNTKPSSAGIHHTVLEFDLKQMFHKRIEAGRRFELRFARFLARWCQYSFSLCENARSGPGPKMGDPDHDTSVKRWSVPLPTGPWSWRRFGACGGTMDDGLLQPCWFRTCTTTGTSWARPRSQPGREPSIGEKPKRRGSGDRYQIFLNSRRH